MFLENWIIIFVSLNYSANSSIYLWIMECLNRTLINPEISKMNYMKTYGLLSLFEFVAELFDLKF